MISVQYAPDRPADVTHVRLVSRWTLSKKPSVARSVPRFTALYEEIKSISFDAIDLQIERITLADGKELPFSNDGKKLTVTLDRPYHYGEEFTRCCALSRQAAHWPAFYQTSSGRPDAPGTGLDIWAATLPQLLVPLP